MTAELVTPAAPTVNFKLNGEDKTVSVAEGSSCARASAACAGFGWPASPCTNPCTSSAPVRASQISSTWKLARTQTQQRHRHRYGRSRHRHRSRSRHRSKHKRTSSGRVFIVADGEGDDFEERRELPLQRSLSSTFDTFEVVLN